MAHQTEKLIKAYLETIEKTLPQSFNDVVQYTKVQSHDSESVEGDGSSAEFEFAELPYPQYQLDVGLPEFLRSLGLKGSEFNFHYFNAYYRFMKMYHEEALKRARQADPVDECALQEMLIVFAYDYFKLVQDIPRGFEEGDLGNLQLKFSIQLQGIEYLRQALALQNISDDDRPTLKQLREFSDQIFALSNFDACRFQKPQVKVDLISEAIAVMEHGLMRAPLRTSANSVDFAESYLLVSEYYYYLAITYRDEFPGNAEQQHKAELSLRNAREMRDRARPSPPISHRNSPVLMTPRSVANNTKISGLIEKTEERHSFLNLESVSELSEEVSDLVELPEMGKREHMDVAKVMFMKQRRKDNAFHLLVSACGKRFKPLSCLVALYDIHREVNRASESNEFLNKVTKFEVYLAKMVSELSTHSLLQMYQSLNSVEGANLINGLFVFHTYWDRLQLQFESDRLHGAAISNAQKLHEVLVCILNTTRMALLLRGIEVLAQDNFLHNQKDDLPDGAEVRLSPTNHKAVMKAMDSINKGKIALLPKEVEHCRSYRNVVHSFRYIFSEKQLTAAFFEMYDKLAEAHPKVKETDQRIQIVEEYIKKAIGLSKTDELVWLHKKLGLSSVQQYFTNIIDARANLGKRNLHSKTPPHRLLYLATIMQTFQNSIQNELENRGLDVKPIARPAPPKSFPTKPSAEEIPLVMEQYTVHN